MTEKNGSGVPFSEGNHEINIGICMEKGVNHVYESVVVDDNIITSCHPRKIQQLGETIISNPVKKK